MSAIAPTPGSSPWWATLAAFAALGRIAFAAVPNVKPTTDIVLIAGYALGGAPGFAVGALAGLTSNFFFGQGPWTPWQMAAWGATGVARRDAGWAMRVAPVPPRRPMGAGRWRSYAARRALPSRWSRTSATGSPSAITAWASWGSTWGRAWASTRSRGRVPGLRAGLRPGADALHPAVRAADRGDVDPRRRVVAPLLLAALVLGRWDPGHARARGGDVSAAAASAAVNYLLGSENADGGFGPAPGQPSDQLYAGWAALGLASAGHDLRRRRRRPGPAWPTSAAGPRPVDVGSLERTILVVRAAGPVGAQLRRPRPGRGAAAPLPARDGSVSGQVNLTAFAVLALRAAGGRGRRRPTLRWLVRQQDADGGFSFAGAGGSSDVDDTGAALEALAGDHAAAGAGPGARSASCAASRTATAASLAARRRAPTPNRRPGRSRD